MIAHLISGCEGGKQVLLFQQVSSARLGTSDTSTGGCDHGDLKPLGGATARSWRPSAVRATMRSNTEALAGGHHG